MIKEKTYHSIICDTCKEDLLHGEEVTGYDSIDAVKEIAFNNGWLIVENGHYCPDCTAYDEESDEFRPRKTDTVFALKKGLDWSISGPNYGVKVNTLQADIYYVVIYAEPANF